MGIRVNDAFAWIGILVCIATCGCGGTYDSTVSGIVTLSGAPVPRGTVKFLPTSTGPSAYGTIASDGRYAVTTGREAGLPSGSYMLTVVANEPSTPNANSALPPTPGKPLAPPWYRDPATSGLTFNVEPGDNEFNIDLTTTPPPGWKPPRDR